MLIQWLNCLSFVFLMVEPVMQRFRVDGIWQTDLGSSLNLTRYSIVILQFWTRSNCHTCIRKTQFQSFLSFCCSKEENNAVLNSFYNGLRILCYFRYYPDRWKLQIFEFSLLRLADGANFFPSLGAALPHLFLSIELTWSKDSLNYIHSAV